MVFAALLAMCLCLCHRLCRYVCICFLSNYLSLSSAFFLSFTIPYNNPSNNPYPNAYPYPNPNTKPNPYPKAGWYPLFKTSFSSALLFKRSQWQWISLGTLKQQCFNEKEWQKRGYEPHQVNVKETPLTASGVNAIAGCDINKPYYYHFRLFH